MAYEVETPLSSLNEWARETIGDKAVDEIFERCRRGKSFRNKHVKKVLFKAIIERMVLDTRDRLSRPCLDASSPMIPTHCYLEWRPQR